MLCICGARRLLTSTLVLAILFAHAAFATSGSFRFAWLSDIHVGSATGEEDLKATVKDINSQTGLAFVILSGDVTENGSMKQLKLAKNLLDEIKIPVHVIPGNHDTKWSESGATDFPRLWKEDRFVFEYGGFRFIGLHQGPLMKMGDGHWAPQDVRWLEQSLKAMTDPNEPILFVTHYPIDDGIANWYVVLDILKRYNIQAALCGHIHRNGKASFEGVPGIMARSNLRGSDTNGGYTIVDIKDAKSMTISERLNTGVAKPAWHSIALENHHFTSERASFPRPDFSINQKYPNVQEKWKFNTGFTIASTPAIWKDKAIVGDASGTVYALSTETGKVAWTFKSQNAVYSTPDVAGDLVVFGSADGNIYALNAATGKEVWTHATGRPIVASPKIDNGVVYIGSSEGKFRALDLDTGKSIWESGGLDGFVETKPLVYDGKVIFGAWDQHLYALDAKTGKLAWKWTGDRPGVMYSPAACWPVASHGKIFIVAPDRKMTALDAATGREVWRTGSYMGRETIGISEDQSRVYVRSMQDYFYAVSTTASDPEKVWATNAAFGYDINSAMITERDGTVFYGTKNGLLFALNGKTGAIEWEHKAGVGIMNTVVPLTGTEVLTTDFDGNITLISEQR